MSNDLTEIDLLCGRRESKPPDTTIEELKAAPIGVWQTAYLHGIPYQNIRGRDCIISLVALAPTSNRGRVFAAIEIFNPLRLYVDLNDGWDGGRYYFDEGRAKAEIEAWLKARNQLGED